MAYAEVADVLARAGRARRTFLQDDDAPGPEEIRLYLEDVAGYLDGSLAAAQVALPLDADGAASRSLVGLNADGALVLALEAAFPSEGADTSARRIYDGAKARFEAGMQMILRGDHPAIEISTGEHGPGSAQSLWTDEPDLDYTENVARSYTMSPSLYPTVRKGMKL